ncbi:MAG: hypothetical protein LBP59_18715 [Planctomycetaceae bacterium]|nr:hypothetical protein [Planctomycetaceae bacterium]
MRFIHTSGFFLDRVIEGLLELPVVLESRFFDISCRAALRVFDKALEESVDFLIISGDVFNALLSPPRLFIFLIEQFERLNKAGITVYWAGSEFDSPDDMPVSFPLPANVRHFPCNSIQEYYFKRSGVNSGGVLAKISGVSRNQRLRKIRNNDFPIESGRQFSIAIANGEVEPESLSQRRINYWAMGGLDRRLTYQGNQRKKGIDGKPTQIEPLNFDDNIKRDKKDTPPYIVHYPGTTVARTPEMTGQFGATLVEVFPDAEPQLSFFETSPIQWINDQIILEANDGIERIKEEIQNRIKNYRNSQKNDDLMINWHIDATQSEQSQLSTILRKETAVNDILNELRKQYGQEEPLTWSVNITFQPPDMLPNQIYEQQTILGDFAREIKQHQNEPEQIINLTKYLPQKLKENINNEQNIEQYNGLLLTDKINDPTTGELKFIQTKEQIKLKQEALKKAANIAAELLNNENTTQFTINLKNDN